MSPRPLPDRPATQTRCRGRTGNGSPTPPELSRGLVESGYVRAPSSAAHRGPLHLEDWRGPPHVQEQPGYFTRFHTAHRSDVNCPSDAAIVTVIDLADVAKLLSMMSPAFDVRSQ